MTQPVVADPFAVGAQRAEGEKVPGVRHLKDRLVIIMPVSPAPGINPKLVPNQLGKPGEMQTRLVADIIVCETGVIMYGGDTKKFVPDSLQMPSPCVIPGGWIFNDVIIEWVMDAYSRGAPMGRIRLAEPKRGGNPYWMMEAPTDADKAIALPIYHQWQAKTLFSAGAPQTAPVQQAFNPAPNMFAGHPGMTPVNPSAPAWPAPTPPPVMPAWPAAIVAPPADWTLDQRPQGFPGDAEHWQSATQEQRIGFLAQLGITSPVKPTGL